MNVHTELWNILDAWYASSEPVHIIVGPYQIGKTYTIRAYFKEKKVSIIDGHARREDMMCAWDKLQFEKTKHVCVIDPLFFEARDGGQAAFKRFLHKQTIKTLVIIDEKYYSSHPESFGCTISHISQDSYDVFRKKVFEICKPETDLEKHTLDEYVKSARRSLSYALNQYAFYKVNPNNPLRIEVNKGKALTGAEAFRDLVQAKPLRSIDANIAVCTAQNIHIPEMCAHLALTHPQSTFELAAQIIEQTSKLDTFAYSLPTEVSKEFTTHMCTSMRSLQTTKTHVDSCLKMRRSVTCKNTKTSQKRGVKGKAETLISLLSKSF
jgi:hypothetical protein